MAILPTPNFLIFPIKKGSCEPFLIVLKYKNGDDVNGFRALFGNITQYRLIFQIECGIHYQTPAYHQESNTLMRKFQIGVMGSMSDLNYSKEFEKAAEKIGEEVAKKDGILFFGAEKDADSLSTAACRGAKKFGGLTIGITYGKHKDVFQKDADVIIPCGLERGGGREFVLVLGCDAIIAISGGSGTLNELAVAYQADIPMVALKGYGGWADKLAGEFFDGRQRRRVELANTPQEAVKIAFKEAQLYREKYER